MISPEGFWTHRQISDLLDRRETVSKTVPSYTFYENRWLDRDLLNSPVEEKVAGWALLGKSETHKDNTNALINRNASVTVQTLLGHWESKQMT